MEDVEQIHRGLIHGLQVKAPKVHVDARGCFCEFYRRSTD
jgi:dTDP-4-dehydrorhamnose 3,5-epimerase-like enzyme